MIETASLPEVVLILRVLSYVIIAGIGFWIGRRTLRPEVPIPADRSFYVIDRETMTISFIPAQRKSDD